ncbi:MAG: hypothetical protein ACTTJ7_06860 [Treponema sp.]
MPILTEQADRLAVFQGFRHGFGKVTVVYWALQMKIKATHKRDVSSMSNFVIETQQLTKRYGAQTVVEAVQSACEKRLHLWAAGA